VFLSISFACQREKADSQKVEREKLRGESVYIGARVWVPEYKEPTAAWQEQKEPKGREGKLSRETHQKSSCGS